MESGNRKAALAYATAGAGMMAMAIVFVGSARLPFQDIPHHELALRLGRAIANGGTSSYLDTAPHSAFAYSLYIHLTNLLAGVAGSEGALAIVASMAALTLPFAVATFAHTCGGSPRWAFVLAMPLALGWHVRMGYVPYSLGVDGAVFWMAAARVLAEKPTPKAATATLVAALVTYLGHPLAWVFGAMGVLATWIFSDRKKEAFGVLAVIGLVTSAIFTWDTVHAAFRQVPETAVTWEPSPVVFRPIPTAAFHVVTRTFGVSHPGHLVPIAAMVAGVVLALPRATVVPSGDRHVATFLVRTTVIFLVIAILTPTALNIGWLIADRFAIFALVLAIVTASRRLSAEAAWGPLVIIASGAMGATLFSVSECHREARRVARITTPLTARFPAGRYLTYRLTDCGAGTFDQLWGHTDPLRGAWSYGADLEAMTPYAFAFSRYHPILYVGSVYAARLRAPHEWDVNESRTASPREACEAYDARQVAKARRTRFDGVMVFGEPERVEDLAVRLGEPPRSRAAPGLVAYARVGEVE